MVFRKYFKEGSGNTYNPIAFKTDNGEVKGTIKGITKDLKDMSLAEFKSRYGSNSFYTIRRVPDEKVMDLMNKATKPSSKKWGE